MAIPCPETDLPGPGVWMWNTPSNNPLSTQLWSELGFSTLILSRSYKIRKKKITIRNFSIFPIHSLCTHKTRRWICYIYHFGFRFSARNYIPCTTYILLGYLNLEQLKMAGKFFSHTLVSGQQITYKEVYSQIEKNRRGRRSKERERKNKFSQHLEMYAYRCQQHKSCTGSIFQTNLGSTAHEIQSLSLWNKILSTLISGSCGTSDVSELLEECSSYLSMENWLLSTQNLEFVVNKRN